MKGKGTMMMTLTPKDFPAAAFVYAGKIAVALIPDTPKTSSPTSQDNTDNHDATRKGLKGSPRCWWADAHHGGHHRRHGRGN